MFGIGARSFLDLDHSASFCIIYDIQKKYTPDLQNKVMLTLVPFYFLIIIISWSSSDFEARPEPLISGDPLPYITLNGNGLNENGARRGEGGRSGEHSQAADFSPRLMGY